MRPFEFQRAASESEATPQALPEPDILPAGRPSST